MEAFKPSWGRRVAAATWLGCSTNRRRRHMPTTRPHTPSGSAHPHMTSPCSHEAHPRSPQVAPPFLGGIKGVGILVQVSLAGGRDWGRQCFRGGGFLSAPALQVGLLIRLFRRPCHNWGHLAGSSGGAVDTLPDGGSPHTTSLPRVPLSCKLICTNAASLGSLPGRWLPELGQPAQHPQPRTSQHTACASRPCMWPARTCKADLNPKPETIDTTAKDLHAANNPPASCLALWRWPQPLFVPAAAFMLVAVAVEAAQRPQPPHGEDSFARRPARPSRLPACSVESH